MMHGEYNVILRSYVIVKIIINLSKVRILFSGWYDTGQCLMSVSVLCTVLATCGQSTKENCTYFVNQGYPGPYDGTGSCQLTINKAHPDICQLRSV